MPFPGPVSPRRLTILGDRELLSKPTGVKRCDGLLPPPARVAASKVQPVLGKKGLGGGVAPNGTGGVDPQRRPSAREVPGGAAPHRHAPDRPPSEGEGADRQSSERPEDA